MGYKIGILIKPSEHNSIPVELIQFNSQVGRPVFLSSRNEDGSSEIKEIPWDQRHQKFDGWQLIGISVRGKNHDEVSHLVPLDAIDYILENFEDGDSVFVSCEINRSEVGDRKYTNYTIRRMYAASEVIDLKQKIFKRLQILEKNLCMMISL